MRLEAERGAANRHHWRLVVTATDVACTDAQLTRRLRVVGGNVHAKLDHANSDRRAALQAATASQE